MFQFLLFVLVSLCSEWNLAGENVTSVPVGDLTPKVKNNEYLNRTENRIPNTSIGTFQESLKSTPCSNLGGFCINHNLCPGYRQLKEVPGCKNQLCCSALTISNSHDQRENEIESPKSLPCSNLGGFCINHNLCPGYRQLKEVPGCKNPLHECCSAITILNSHDQRANEISHLGLPLGSTRQEESARNVVTKTRKKHRNRGSKKKKGKHSKRKRTYVYLK